MTDNMPKKLPFLQKERTRHGTTVWYVRIDRGPRIRIRGKYGSEEFMSQYRAAISGEAVSQAKEDRQSNDPRTLSWLIDQWRNSSNWGQTAASTRRQRENILKRVIADNPRVRFKDIKPEHIIAGRERRQVTPEAANGFVKVMRALYKWAVSACLVDENPAEKVAFINVKTDGFRPWNLDDLERFRQKWPLGTRERVALEVLVNTGLRRGDAVRLGRQHIRDGVATIRAEKTGVELHIPILPTLHEALQAGPTGDLSFICGVNGSPMTKESFGNWFRKACTTAKVKGSAHGIRKLAATIIADHGGSEHELQAMFGWQTNKQSAVYTGEANKKRLALQAASKLAESEHMRTNQSRTLSQVRENGKKTK